MSKKNYKSIYILNLSFFEEVNYSFFLFMFSNFKEKLNVTFNENTTFRSYEAYVFFELFIFLKYLKR